MFVYSGTFKISEVKHSQIQMIDVPVEITNNMIEVQLNNYFNGPKVNKKTG